MPDITGPTGATGATGTTGSTGASGATASDSPLIAGKYRDAQAAEKGIRELNKELGLEPIPDGPLIGEGRMFVDVLGLEAGIKSRETLYGKMKTPDKPATPATEIKTGEPLQIAAPTAPTGATGPAADEDPDPDALLAKAGMTRAELYKTWNETGGKLTDDQYAKAKKVGLGPKLFQHLVGTGVVAHQASVAEVQRIAADTAGGKDKLGALLGWAGGKYTEAERADLQARINNPALTASVVRQLQHEYAVGIDAANSRPTVSGGVTTSVGGGASDIAEYESLLEKVNEGRATKAEEERFYATNPQMVLNGR